MFADYREPLVEVASQVLCVTLDHEGPPASPVSVDGTGTGATLEGSHEVGFSHDVIMPILGMSQFMEITFRFENHGKCMETLTM